MSQSVVYYPYTKQQGDTPMTTQITHHIPSADITVGKPVDNESLLPFTTSLAMLDAHDTRPDRTLLAFHGSVATHAATVGAWWADTYSHRGL